MPTNKTAALRHGPRFKKQLAAMNESYEQHLECERARAAVVKAVMSEWRAGRLITLDTATYAACATLAKLEAK